MGPILALTTSRFTTRSTLTRRIVSSPSDRSGEVSSWSPARNVMMMSCGSLVRGWRPKMSANASRNSKERNMSDEIRELTDRDFARAMPKRQRERILRGELAGGEDVVALRRFVGLTQQQFADALGISVHTLRNWEQSRRSPEGPALALLRIAARHPRVLRENLAAAV